ncbi:hypothetical protein JAO76_00090 [Pontibacter sp. BT310]|uniref:Uncharacterized protein n=1 Tax=Pontibacter populi TaxID=890055 RepID=A0ABS6X8C8_9BACT|nr:MULTISPECIES: hypothetical protein [Pontibacter]MBJ6116572.1 hypothetical protein [Pontibacter sp. BT310]MBR0568996.1 hypothetical protein [Microvirga sp. STS03]MBW3363425.1 hypothetical protein [Pontibacter populi]
MSFKFIVAGLTCPKLPYPSPLLKTGEGVFVIANGYSFIVRIAGAGLQPVSYYGVEFVTQLARQALSESGFTGLTDFQDWIFTAIVL